MADKDVQDVATGMWGWGSLRRKCLKVLHSVQALQAISATSSSSSLNVSDILSNTWIY